MLIRVCREITRAKHIGFLFYATLLLFDACWLQGSIDLALVIKKLKKKLVKLEILPLRVWLKTNILCVLLI